MRWTKAFSPLLSVAVLAFGTNAIAAPSGEGKLVDTTATDLAAAQVSVDEKLTVTVPETMGQWYATCVKGVEACDAAIEKIVRSELGSIESRCSAEYLKQFLNLEADLAQEFKRNSIARIRTSESLEFGDPLMFASPEDTFHAWLNDTCPVTDAPKDDAAGAEGAAAAEADEVQAVINTAQIQDTESLVWTRASEEGTVESFNAYLALYPQGKFAKTAQSIINVLDSYEGSADADAAGVKQQAGGELVIEGDLTGSAPILQAADPAKQGPVQKLVSGLSIEARSVEIMRQMTSPDVDATKLAALLKELNELLSGANEVLSANGRDFESTLTDREKEDIQRDLEVLGYYSKGIDGDFGRTMSSGTRRGIKAFQKVIGYPDTGYMTEAVASLLRAEADRIREEFEPEITEETRQAVLLERTFSRDRKRQIQDSLNRSGFSAGGTDGVLGTNTRRAIRSFQRFLGRSTSGYLTSFELQVLQERAPFRDPSLLKPKPRAPRESVDRRESVGRGGSTARRVSRGVDGPKLNTRYSPYYHMWIRNSGHTYAKCYQTTRIGTKVSSVDNSYCVHIVGYYYDYFKPSGYTYAQCYMFTPSGRRVASVKNSNCQGR